VEGVRRERSATESLLSITLVLDVFLVFFVSLAVFALDLVAPFAAFGGGALLVVLLVVAARLVRYPFGVWLGWALQLVLIATGLLVPIMYVIGAGFLALYAYCFFKGRALDAARPAETPKETP
jgi:hypothetical protein